MKKFLLICILLILSTQISIAQDIFQESQDIYSTEDIFNKIKAYPNSKVLIRSALSLSGDLRIETGDQDIAEIVYTKKAKTKSKSQAIDFIDLISADLESTPDGIRVTLRAPNPAPWSGTNYSGRIELTLIIPDFCDVEIDAMHFDVEAEGPFDSFSIPQTFGRIDITNVIERLNIVASNRKVSASSLSGEVYISTTNAELEIQDVTSVDKKVELRNDNGDIIGSDISGELFIRTSYGKIELESVKLSGDNNYIRSEYGPILLDIISCKTKNISITNKHEDIELNLPKTISSSLSLAVEEGGKIEVTDLKLKPELVTKTRLILNVKDGETIINGSIRGSGNIYLRGHDTGE